MNGFIQNLFSSALTATLFSIPLYFFVRYFEKSGHLGVRSQASLWTLFNIFLAALLLIRLNRLQLYSFPIPEIPVVFHDEQSFPILQNDSESVSFTLDYALLFSRIYLLAAIQCLLMFLVAPLLRSIRLYGENFYCTDDRILKIAMNAQKSLGIEKRIRIVISAQQSTPCVGLLKPTEVILPKKIADKSDELLFSVLVHEMAHIRQHDPLLFAATALLKALFWFNPFAHLAIRRWRHTRELLCDTAVATLSPGVIDYAEYLLELSRVKMRRQHAATCVSGENLEDRIMKILHPQNTYRTPMAVVFTLVAVFIFTFATGAPGAAADDLFSPIEGAYHISSPFGNRVLQGKEGFHTGIDLAAPMGTAIKSAADGTVIYSRYDEKMGNMVQLDHGNGLITVYTKMQGLLVEEGRKVRQGELIGKIGMTGVTTGPHLHFEVRVNGNAVDPEPYLKRKQ